MLSGTAAVLALGDNQYERRRAVQLHAARYDPTWGRVKAITRPALGNHEYTTAGATGYFDYFNGAGAVGGPGRRPRQGLLQLRRRSWHLVVLNSNCGDVACAAGSAQERWLRADLAAHPAPCTLAYWHHPRFSSGRRTATDAVQPLWQALYDGGADLVLAGHDHDYERFAPQDPSGAARPARRHPRVRGRHRRHVASAPSAPRSRNSEVRDNETFGVLELTLGGVGYYWRFVPVAGGTFADAGTGGCHAAPPKRRPKPKSPTPKKKKKTRCTVTGTAGPMCCAGRAAGTSSAASAATTASTAREGTT